MDTIQAVEVSSAGQPSHSAPYKNYRDVGKFAIFYHPNTEGHEALEGTETDAKQLAQTAKSLGFDVDEPYRNMYRADLENKLEEYVEMNHTNSSCFVVAITGHGGYNDTLLGSDAVEYDLSTVLDKFRAKNCPKLKGKPKIFIIDTCRGELEDRGAPSFEASASADSITKILTVPVEADFLVMQATYPEYGASVTTDRGSTFTSNLCSVLHDKDMYDIFDILTRVSRNTAEESCQYNDPQMPSFTSQLTAPLHLRDPPDPQQLRTEILYKMENPSRGHFYIFSNEGLQGCDDVELLEECGQNLGFVTKHRGLNEMMETATEYVNGNHTDHDCLVCVIITYSQDHDVLHVGKNETLNLKNFVELFHGNQCSGLLGKPKIFIVQAPYNRITKGKKRQNAVHTIPETADTVIFYSISPEKSGNRTLFIEELCRHLKPSRGGLDLFEVFTKVTERMSRVVGLHVPSVTSQLRERVVFK